MAEVLTDPNNGNVNRVTLPSLYQQQIHKSKYAKWVEELGRREHWNETVDRYVSQLSRQVAKCGISQELWEPTKKEIRNAILNLEAMPSMRAVMTAGPALERDNVSGYNCAFIAVNSTKAFDEALYILCCGTGVGFSVERQFTEQLPTVPKLSPSSVTILVGDSKIGWAKSLRTLIESLYMGDVPSWDVSQVRPAGSKLKTMGGRASGPGPLVELFEYVIKTFKDAQGRQLTPRECHGIMCKVGDIVVVGGVRRSALISLSDPDDEEMRDAKSGEWYIDHGEYALANNSAVWNGRPERSIFDTEWAALVASGSGERGFINRRGMQDKVAQNGRRDSNYVFGTNPCSEIILRPNQFCNLSEVVARQDDTIYSLRHKVYIAAIIGTIQSTFTDFRYLSDEWKQNCEEERLLGVSITGIMDNAILAGTHGNPAVLENWLDDLRDWAVHTNEVWSAMLGINPATAVTCVKPSGTVSQLVDAASGIHPRWAKKYIRTNRGNKIDPVAQFLYMQGIPTEDDVMKPEVGYVFAFPIKSPEGSITRDQLSALDQLNLWMIYAEHWCEHKPSITVYVREEEWQSVGDFVYDNFDKMSGVSFLPYSDHSYQQAPYQDVTDEVFNALELEMPDALNWDLLTVYESEDQTTSTHELACMAGGCEI